MEGWEGGSRADQIGKPGMNDSGKQISEALLVAASEIQVMVFWRVEGVLRRWGETWAAATRRLGRGILATAEEDCVECRDERSQLKSKEQLSKVLMLWEGMFLRLSAIRLLHRSRYESIIRQ